MRIARLTRVPGPIAFWTLAAVALLVSHDAVFIAQMGPGEAMVRALRSAGHAYWGTASLVLAVIAVGGGIVAAVRLLALHHRARRLRFQEPLEGPSFVSRLLATWSRLFALVALGFVLQESAEHAAMHGHAIGLGALVGPEYPLALPVIGLITVVAAAIATLIARTEAVLLATIAVGLRRPIRRAPRTLQRPPLRLTAHRLSVLADAAAGRAPPRMLVSAS